MNIVKLNRNQDFNKIARTTIQTDLSKQFGNIIGESDLNQIDEYKNGKIIYKNKVYIGEKITDFQKRKYNDFIALLEKGISKIDDNEIFKQFLISNSNKYLKETAQRLIRYYIANQPNAFENSDNVLMKKDGDYVFQLRKGQNGQEESKTNEKDKSEVDEEKINVQFEHELENIKNAKEEIAKFVKEAKKKFLKDFLNKPFNDKKAQGQRLKTLLHDKIFALLDAYDRSIDSIQTVKDSTSSQEEKKLIQKAIDNLENEQQQYTKNIQKTEDTFFKELVGQQPKEEKSDSQEIDGKQYKEIQKLPNAYLMQQKDKNTYTLFNYDKTFAFYEQIPEKIKYYENSELYAFKTGDIYVLADNKFTAFRKNANQINTDGIKDRQFFNDYVIVKNDGTYEIHKSGDLDTSILTADDLNELLKKMKAENKFKDYFNSTAAPTPTPPTATKFKFTTFKTKSSQADMEAYVNSTDGEIKIKNNTFDTLNKEQRNVLIKSGRLILSKIKNIKISRKNRHLSLEQTMLNSIFSKLK